MSLEKKIIAIAKALKVNFTLQDRTLTYEEVFADTGLMPAIAKRADQLCSLCLGYGIGLSFEETKESMLGSRVIFDDLTPDSLRCLYITDIICELMYTAPTKTATPLDELMYE